MMPTALLDRAPAVADRQRKLRGEISPNAQPAWLYDAVRQTVHATRGTAKVIQDALGSTYQHVTDLADASRHVALKAFEIPDIVRATGSFAILDALEAKVGRVAFTLPATNPNVDEMNRELARTVKEFGAFLETNGDVLADGVIEPREVPPLLGAIDQMLADLSEYRALVVRKAERDGCAVRR